MKNTFAKESIDFKKSEGRRCNRCGHSCSATACGCAPLNGTRVCGVGICPGCFR